MAEVFAKWRTSGALSLPKRYATENTSNDGSDASYSDLTLNYSLNGMPTSYNETRPKTKFFSLMIYAGYPMQ